ncbi:MAG: response regulator [Vicinamibacterales bacterium]
MTTNTRPVVRHPRTLLVVDDDAAFRTRLARALEARGFSTTAASGYDDALAAARAETPECALVDLKLEGRSGLDVVRDLRALDATTTIVVLTGYGSIATAVQAVKLGAHAYLTKPVDADQIVATFAGDEAAEDLSSASTPVQPLARVEWEHIQRVLADCDGNISQAARLLGIHRRSLQRKLLKNPTPEVPPESNP